MNTSNNYSTIKEFNDGNGKTHEPNKIPIEILKLINEEHIHVLTQLFNRIYRFGQIPKVY